jgi:hypothetical protein
MIASSRYARERPIACNNAPHSPSTVRTPIHGSKAILARLRVVNVDALDLTPLQQE